MLYENDATILYNYVRNSYNKVNNLVKATKLKIINNKQILSLKNKKI